MLLALNLLLAATKGDFLSYFIVVCGFGKGGPGWRRKMRPADLSGPPPLVEGLRKLLGYCWKAVLMVCERGGLSERSVELYAVWLCYWQDDLLGETKCWKLWALNICKSRNFQAQFRLKILNCFKMHYYKRLQAKWSKLLFSNYFIAVCKIKKCSTDL